ncbi:protein toll-like [Ceratitis capitata]|uniref:protein toll-like n=1 Tax=Ceratitis capitata TaxID=7213 RepID=UPI000A11C144|nr:protein toll-like [Ceratitis capitata]
MRTLRAHALSVLLLFFCVACGTCANESPNAEYPTQRTLCYDGEGGKCFCDTDNRVECEFTDNFGKVSYITSHTSDSFEMNCEGDPKNISALLEHAPRRKGSSMGNEIALQMTNCMEIPQRLIKPNATYDLNISFNKPVPRDFFWRIENIASLILNYQVGEDVLQSKIFKNIKNIRLLHFFVLPATTTSRKSSEAHAVPADLFEPLSNLEGLSFQLDGYENMPSRIRLRGLSRSVHLQNLQSLRYFALRGFEMEPLTGDLFSTMPHLEFLWLQGCGLKALPHDLLKAQRNLLVLNLSDNFLEDLPAELLKNTKQLYQLNLRGNRFSNVVNIIRNIRSLSFLHRLDLAANLLYTVRGSQENETLLSSFRNTVELPDEMLKKLAEILPWENKRPPANLTVIDLSRNRISAFNKPWLDVAQLREPFLLNISDNKIKAIHSLHALVVDSNHCRGEIDLIGNPLVCDCSLAWIYNNNQCILSPSNLLCYEPTTTKKAVSIYYADSTALCPYSPVMCPNECVCATVDNYLHINCSHGKIHTLPRLPRPEQVAANGTKLSITHNHLIALPSNTFFGYANVTQLNVSHNGITELLVAQLPAHLSLLDVRENSLTQLRADFVQTYLNDSRALVQLYLSGNPWRCDCSAEPLLHALRAFRKRIPDAGLLMCANLRNVRVLDFDYRHTCGV